MTTPQIDPINDFLASSVALNKTSLQLSTINNKTAQLIATVLPVNTSNKTIQWLSSNTSIATVSSSGLVTALRKDNVMIGAFTTDGTKKYSIAYVNITATMGLIK
jgi:uncharacterized protein YjdB